MTTNIEWVVSQDGSQGKTWNPIIGCSKVSPGCAYCYAEAMAKRLRAMGRPEYQDVVDDRGHWTGKVVMVPERLEEPLRRRKPTTYFVNSMSDLFHESLAFEDIMRVYRTMYNSRWHTYQVLTKRPERMLAFFRHWDELTTTCNREAFTHFYRHVWHGVSVENQEAADKRIPHLLQVPGLRFLSCEPLLEGVGLRQDWLEPSAFTMDSITLEGECLPERPRIDWVIVGGESGPRARPMKEEWALDLVRQCKAAGVPVFVKQMGAAWAAGYRDLKGHDMQWWPEELRVREMPHVLA